MILYSTGCPKCKILEKKLDSKNIEYTLCNDVDLMISKGMKQAPMLECDDGTVLDFAVANKYINSLEV